MAAAVWVWEMDPFFPAAEEVQNSTDRMESIYRTWKYSRNLAEASPDDTALLSAVHVNQRDLFTALDTVRWQLEEFARAVDAATSSEQVYVGEDAGVRHSQFVRAIQSQIAMVEAELGSNSRVPSHSRYAALDDADRDYLALFLGEAASAVDDDNQHSAANIPEAQRQECCSTTPTHSQLDYLSSYHYQPQQPSVCSSLESSYFHSDVGNNNNSGGSNNSRVVYERESSSSSSSSASSSSSSSSDFYNSSSNCSSDGGGGGGGGWWWWRWRSRMMLLFSSSSSSDKQHRLLQLSGSGLKRWKDGDATGLLEDAEECIYALKERCFLGGDVEQQQQQQQHLQQQQGGAGGRRKWSWLRRMVELLADDRGTPSPSSSGWSAAVSSLQQRRWLSSSSSPPWPRCCCFCSSSVWSAVQITAAVLLLGLLMSAYFWFLSTLVPLDEVNVPGNFVIYK